MTYRYNAFKTGLCTTFFDYIVDAYENGLPFSREGGEFKDIFQSLQSGGAPAPVEEEKKEEVKKEKPSKKSGAKEDKPKPKREPKKVKIGKVWDISYYENETFEYKEGELDMTETLMVSVCNSSNFITHGKIKSVILNNCTNCAVVVDTIVSSIECMN